MLVMRHVNNQTVMDVATVNSTEILVLSGNELKPNANIGCKLEETLASCYESTSSSYQESSLGQHLLELYASENYILGWSVEDSRAFITLKENADNSSVLRALWQSTWLEHYHQNMADVNSLDGGKLDILEQSHAALCREYPKFEGELEELGWQLSLSYLVPDQGSRMQ